MNQPRDPFPEFEDLVASLIQVPRDPEASISKKIDLLERLIEQWRIDRHELKNGVDFEEFLVWESFIEKDTLIFDQSSEPIDTRVGTPPVRLQRKLLVFLLLHHGKYDHVLQIITAFVHKIRADLDVRDFKKTETGVFRCFTNTRFAANKLRDYGLLKYTHTERFKVWVLSLPGIVVAAKSLQFPDWALPAVDSPWYGLDSFTLESLHEAKSFPGLVDTLQSICSPNVKVFDTFDHVLHQAHDILSEYWKIISDPDLKAKEREGHSCRCIEKLDTIIGYSDFLEKFINCVQIESLLKHADHAAENL